jgi:hypothetical protein
MKRWNTMRLSLYGACAGVAYFAAVDARYWSLGPEGIGRLVGELIGGAIGGFLVAGLICELRSKLVRAK